LKPVAASCRADAGVKLPIIDPKRCEAKADCVRVCPYDVFELRALTAGEKRDLGVLGRLKVAAHGGKQAFAVHADQCHACGLCVAACPEKAIRLIPAIPPS
jgi:4Fe-4S ferredoxin